MRGRFTRGIYGLAPIFTQRHFGKLSFGYLHPKPTVKLVERIVQGFNVRTGSDTVRFTQDFDYGVSSHPDVQPGRKIPLLTG